ncbi:uncharacterized protein [Dendrobates tinctorius]|uniref:uncharacterized protein n=1 Tax=Dendrobates tinctorius TaxID=92724 RepID=UPI003CC933C5
MNIIIEKNVSSLKMTETEIETLQKSLQQELSSDKFQEMITALEKDVEKWEATISLNKQKKYERYLGDFEANKIFRWQIKKELAKGNISRSSSIVSSSSLSEGGGSNYEGRYSPRTRQFYKKNSSQRKYEKDSVKVINLSSHLLTEAQESVLYKGLTFSPSCNLDQFTVTKDLNLFARKLVLKKFHSKNNADEMLSSNEEQQALGILESLIEENTPSCSLMAVSPQMFFANQHLLIRYHMPHRPIQDLQYKAYQLDSYCE